jgi:serine/threonine protein kinase
MSAVLDPFVLPADVVISPLRPAVRERLADTIGEYSVTRPRSRSQSSVVDGATAGLLATFREPTTIVDAVIAFSAARGLDPRATLEDALDVLGGFVNDGLLVPPGSELAKPIASSLSEGDRVSSFEVVAPLQLLVDTEVHLARGPEGAPAALKIARQRDDARMRAALDHEALILRRLDGRAIPRLLEAGEHDGRPFIALSWCAGIDVFAAAAEARRLDEPAARHELLRLAEGVIAAYAHVHAQGVLHGDVHARNVLAAGDGTVTIIDFGLAASGAVSAARGGVDFFLEPELAAARLAGDPAPPLTAAGEQYSVGALLYLLLTGSHTHSFSLEPEAMLRQLLKEPPSPFARHGVDAPAVERAVFRALAKDPRRRYRSLADLERAFRAAAAHDRGLTRPAGGPRPEAQLLDGVLRRLDVPGELHATGLTAPTASAIHGAAGIAYALLRIAEIRDDEHLLALADLWAIKAQADARFEHGFVSAELELVPAKVGSNSLHHHASGVHCVAGLVARARGDEAAQQLALDAFIAAAGGPCEHVDVAFGLAGLTIGCAIALEALAPALDASALRSLGSRLHDDLWDALDRQPPIAEPMGLRSLGAAHGWAGCLFALLRWSAASATALPAGLEERLDELAALARPAGRGLRWPHEAGALAAETSIAAGWCNGAAGHVPLWTLAHAQLADGRWGRLAELAGWSANDGPTAAPGDLCCGLAGRAYALLCLYRHTGEEAWLARARALAGRAAASVRVKSWRRDSLYQGGVGVALLAADVEEPNGACMPLFDSPAAVAPLDIVRPVTLRSPTRRETGQSP